MKTLPVARTQNLVMQNFNKEVLLYDLLTNKIYRLNETSTIIYLACDGKTEFSDLVSKHQFTEELIYLSLRLLQKENLIEAKQSNYLGTLSRREMAHKVGLTTMLALPVISSLIAPQAAEAQSINCLNDTCTFDNFNQGDCCSSEFRCYNSTTPNRCTNCFPSGSEFAWAPPSATVDFCNDITIVPAKNVCCNSGVATADGTSCYCP